MQYVHELARRKRQQEQQTQKKKTVQNKEVVQIKQTGVTDIKLLGSAIYSKWRYFNHLTYDESEILLPENRAWFILALSRLAVLTSENPFVFHGDLKAIQIISNALCYGPCPEPDDEIEQHIRILSDGNTEISFYRFGQGIGHYEKCKTETSKLDEKHLNRLFSAFTTFFSNEYFEIFPKDIGNWHMELINSDGIGYRFSGALCANFEVNGINLSDLTRESLGMPGLYVFDGNNKSDKKNKK